MPILLAEPNSSHGLRTRTSPYGEFDDMPAALHTSQHSHWPLLATPTAHRPPLTASPPHPFLRVSAPRCRSQRALRRRRRTSEHRAGTPAQVGRRAHARGGP